jgi:hypothetical protein
LRYRNNRSRSQNPVDLITSTSRKPFSHPHPLICSEVTWIGDCHRTTSQLWLPKLQNPDTCPIQSPSLSANGVRVPTAVDMGCAAQQHIQPSVWKIYGLDLHIWCYDSMYNWGHGKCHALLGSRKVGALLTASVALSHFTLWCTGIDSDRRNCNDCDGVSSCDSGTYGGFSVFSLEPLAQDPREGEITDMRCGNLFNPLPLTLFCPDQGLNISCGYHCCLFVWGVSTANIPFRTVDKILCRSVLRGGQTVRTGCVLQLCAVGLLVCC